MCMFKYYCNYTAVCRLCAAYSLGELGAFDSFFSPERERESRAASRPRREGEARRRREPRARARARAAARSFDLALFTAGGTGSGRD